jgi:hypothetical protein
MIAGNGVKQRKQNQEKKKVLSKKEEKKNRERYIPWHGQSSLV